MELSIYLATRKSTQLTARYASNMKSQTPGENGSKKEKYPGLLPYKNTQATSRHRNKHPKDPISLYHSIPVSKHSG